MRGRKKIDKEVLFNEIEQLSRSLSEDLDVYLIGGLAMMYRDLKVATKDVDVVLEDEGKAFIFKDNLVRNGYVGTNPVTEEYSRLATYALFEKPHGCRFDIFVGKVCEKLLLSDTMKLRAVRMPLPGNMKLHVVSPGDIFVFKSITGRDEDLKDMVSIAEKGLNWNIIAKEMRDQPNSWRWNVMFYQSLQVLEEEYSIRSPLKEKFREEAEISAGIGIALSKLEGHPISYSDLIGIIDEDAEFSKTVFDRMMELNLIHDENGLISTSEAQITRRLWIDHFPVSWIIK